MYCGKCGNEMDDNAKVCERCGTPVDNRQMKSVIGISICLLGAGVFWAGLASELLAFLLIGYILLCEKDLWLRAIALKAAVVIIGFFALQSVFYIVQNVLDGFNVLLVLVGTNSLGYSGLYQFCNLCLEVLGIAKSVILLIAGYMALNYRNLKMGLLDKIVNRSIEKNNMEMK